MLDLISRLDYLVPFFQSPIGALLFVPFYALWVICLLPGVWISMLAGAIYGTWYGSLLVFVGASIGAEIAFLLCRTFVRPWLEKRFEKNQKINAIQEAVNLQGFKLVLLTRLSPVFPFSLLNFAYGLSQVSFRNYSIGLLGILPGTIIFCELGSFAGEIARFGEVIEKGGGFQVTFLRFVGGLATITIVWIFAFAIKRSIQVSSDSIT